MRRRDILKCATFVPLAAAVMLSACTPADLLLEPDGAAPADTGPDLLLDADGNAILDVNGAAVREAEQDAARRRSDLAQQ